MHTTLRILLYISLIMVFSCTSKSKKAVTENQAKEEMAIDSVQPSKADVLVAETIEAHGGRRYDTASYGFTFRDKTYTFENGKNGYRYTASSIENTDTIQDILENGKLTRTINRKIVALSEKDNAKYTEALNSVVYFATLPSKLNDKAVNKTYEGRTTIKNLEYELLSIDFDEEGGGKDYDDKFLYWINADTKTVDYLAYSYSTNDGGVRFRSAFNPRTVAGIRFQDYINYEVPIGTPLKNLSQLYEDGKLKELSKIITKDVRIME
ncbi:hypothetical protein FGM00_02485 [Aggregatimonas sangjinii]|uniref:Deoxyribose-phosphate aldolase n=1 Tax=Aggregatimonas sangjinii TaxID=2583587 RepID=A0A5B7SNP5_9FLAO|nr:DUF6503 family protein [Aggregatimonas sangjinii]QCW99038.1 hypothetical protein FGM00_02485 [Aggregatimonas sangjinii]